MYPNIVRLRTLSDTILALKVAIVFNNDSIDHSSREIPRATEKK